MAFVIAAGCGGEADPVPSVPCGGSCGANELCHEDVCLGSVAWSVELPLNVQGEVAVAQDGVVIASSAPQVGDVYQPTVVGISPEGEMLFETPIGLRNAFGFPSRPVLGIDGHIYLTVNFSLFSLDPDGYLDWSLDAPRKDGHIAVNAANPPPPPSIGLDGTVYWQFLAASGIRGDLRWRHPVDPYTPCETALPMRSDRVLFREDQRLVAITDRGGIAWEAVRPLDYFGEPGCGMLPYDDELIATLWCEPGASAFVCGHLLFIDVERGTVAWHLAPPKKVAMATAMVMRPDRSLAIFSRGAPGNDGDFARMWIVSPDGQSTSDSIVLPWRGVHHAAIGDDGIFYVTTSAGLAAIDENGSVLWRYEPDHAEGSYSGPPAIGSNGCIYYETVRQAGGRAEYGREISCVRSSATQLADSPWPRNIGGNHSGMRSP
jgi:hypothetical protein